jgi:hypothetical protein
MTGMLDTTAKLSPRRIHMQAMDLADEAARLRKADQTDQARLIFEQAFNLESQAAELTQREPGRSILHLSAARLALEFDATRSAEKMIARALAGDPPVGMAEELRNLLETVNFRRHLTTEGIELGPREFQFSIAGAGVDYGAAPSDDVLKRVTDVQKMLLRTAQRKQNISFETASKSGRKDNENLALYMEVPRASSYAVTLRLGQKPGMEPLFRNVDDFAAEVIQEVLQCIELVDNGQLKELEERIGEPSYYDNFVGLAKNIAPDGKTVSLVGFTTQEIIQERQVKLSVTRQDIGKQIKEKSLEKARKDESQETGDQVVIQGTLKAADSMRNSHHIKLQGDDGKPYTIIVPKGLMNDVVRPHFGNHVEVTGLSYGTGRIILSDILNLTS